MKIEFDKKKSGEMLAGLVQGAADLGKKAAADAKAGVAAMVEKSKADEYARRLKKYNPLFPAQYHSEEFHIPNIVVIVDDAVRKGIDVCEGAIGWLGKELGEEILYLYDESIADSGVQFVPAPICNAVYYVDHFDRNRFIQTECIFSRTLKEKMDELQHIAESIGAKRCVIDIREASRNSKTKQKVADLSVSMEKGSGSASAESEDTSESGKKQSGHLDVRFTGLRLPKRPTMKWFAYDDSITNLVESCCTGKRRVKNITIDLSGSTFATMSHSIACAIDGIVGKSANAKGHASMKTQAKEEYQSKMHIYIEF